MTTTVDCIVVGAGHNGLTAACYLAKAGLDVCILERRPDIGGAVATHDMFGGYQMDVGGSAHIMIHATPVVSDLALEDHGLTYIEMDPWAYYPIRSGGGIAFYRDLERTCDSIATVSPADAAAYRDFVKFWREINEGVFASFLKPPTPGNLLRTMMSGRFGKKGGEVAGTLRKIFTSYGQLILETFSSQPMRSAMLWLAAQSGPPPGEVATGDFAGWQSMIHLHGAKRPQGGSGMLTQALARRLESDGGTVRTDAPVDKILLEGERAVGVRLKSGEELLARKAVISATHILTTMFGLIGRDRLPSSLADDVDKIRVGNGFGMFLRCATDALPENEGSATRSGESDPRHTGLQLLCPSPDYLDNAYADFLRGMPSRDPAVLAMTFSAIDPSLAPEGHHTLFLWSQYHPYERRDGKKWDDVKEAEADRIIDVLVEHAPNMAGSISDRFVQTPLDIERLHGMHRGNVMHVEMSFDQMFLFRPTPSLSDYRTPFANLYLTGASMHPGGGIFAASGYNVAQVVLRDNRRLFRRG